MTTPTYTLDEQRENRRKWIAALRSGEYKQGTMALRRDFASGSQYCCLGVACDISGLVEWHTAAGGAYGTPIEAIDSAALSQGSLPPDVQDWLGIRSRIGAFYRGDEYVSLSGLNDEEYYSFEEIAQVLETSPPELWTETATLPVDELDD